MLFETPFYQSSREKESLFREKGVLQTHFAEENKSITFENRSIFKENFLAKSMARSLN